MALPVAFPRLKGIRDMVTALPGSPRAVPPTGDQISPPDLLHGARAACSQPVWWCGSTSVPSEMKCAGAKGCWGASGVAGGDCGVVGRVIAFEFY